MALRVGIIGSTTATGAPTWRDSELQAFERWFLREGVIQRGGNDLQVVENGTPNMTVVVKAGEALIEITNTNLTPSETYKVYFTNDADYPLVVPTADGTNPRRDRVVARVAVNTNPNAAASNIAILEYLTGTPAGSPVAPAEPANAITLAIVDVPASDTAIQNAQITDSRPYADAPNSDVLMGLVRQGLGNMTVDAGGTANALTATYTPPLTALTDKFTVVVVPTANNTGAATFSPNGLTAKSIVKLGNTALSANDLKARFPAVLTYNSTDDNWKLQNPANNQTLNPNTYLPAAIARPAMPYPCANLTHVTQMGSIAYDAQSTYNGSSSNTSHSWNHTATGSNRTVMVGFYINTTANDVTNVTYGGVAMRQVSTVSNGSVRVYLYQLIAPATGSQSISITLGASRQLFGTAASYTGTYQEYGPDATSTVTAASGTTLTTNHTTIADNAWTVFFAENAFGNFTGGTATARFSARGNGIFDSNGPRTPPGLVNTLTATYGGSATSEMAAGSIAPVKSGPDLPVLDFDQSQQEIAEFYAPLPAHYTGGTFTAKFHWIAAAGSGDVVWGIRARALADQDDTASAFGTGQTVTDTRVAGKHHITNSTAAVTIGGSPAAGQMCCFQVYRDAQNAADTLSADARLVGVEIVL